VAFKFKAPECGGAILGDPCAGRVSAHAAVLVRWLNLVFKSIIMTMLSMNHLRSSFFSLGLHPDMHFPWMLFVSRPLAF